MYWRQAISVIRNVLVGGRGSVWRDDLHAIAEHYGGSPRSWNEAIKIWAEVNGVFENAWWRRLIVLAVTVTGRVPRNWREALCFLACHYSVECDCGTQIVSENVFAFNIPPRIATNRYVLLSNGVLLEDLHLMN